MPSTPLANILPLVALCLVPLPALCQTADTGIVAPEGWRSERTGSDTVLTPKDLPEGEVFTFTIKPPTPRPAQSLGEWFEARVRADAATRGTEIGDGPIVPKNSNGPLTYTSKFRDPSGALFGVAYIGILRTDEQAQLAIVVSTPKKETFERYLPDVAKTFLRSADLKGVAKTRGTTPETTPRPKPEPNKEATLYRTKPGAGIPTSQIEGVYMIPSYQMGVGGYMYMVYNPYLFLKDGWYWKRFSVPPADLDVAASRANDPKAWGRWKRDGKGFLIQNDKGEWKPHKAQEALPARKGERLTGTFTHLTGGGNVAVGGGTMIAVQTSYTFAPDGNFRDSRFAGASSAEPSSPSSVTTYSKSGYDGTYSIDGYTIELRYRDGRVERKPFAYMDAKAKDAVYIGSVVYLNKKK